MIPTKFKQPQELNIKNKLLEYFTKLAIKDAKAVIKEAITVYDNTEKDEIKNLLKSILDSISNINAEIDDLIIDLGDLEETVDQYRE